MIRVAILGATGYSALELFKILLRHPEVEITCATSRQEGNPPLGTVHPSLAGRLDLRLEDLPPAAVAARADCVFGCLPHGVTAAIMPELLAGKTKVIDLSADYRLKSPAVYEQWYNQKHADPERLATAVYGLPELFREEIVPAQLIANPGCYPTSAILALAPLLKRGVIKADGIIIDSKSGVSGAGRTPKLNFAFPGMQRKRFGLQRRPASAHAGNRAGSEHGERVGRATDLHAAPDSDGSRHVVDDLFLPEAADQRRETAGNAPRVLRRRAVRAAWSTTCPRPRTTVGSNFCNVTARVVRDRIVTVSCLDNLIKGAAGAAVQNMNLMFGLKETTALL